MSQSKKENSISLPVYLHGSGRPVAGGVMPAVGLRINNHELAVQGPNLNQWNRGKVLGAHYRYYLPGYGKPLSPYVAFDAGVHRSWIPLSIIGGNDTILYRRSKGIYLALGTDYRFTKRLSGYAMLGYGYVGLIYEWPRETWHYGVAPQLSFGLKYDIPLKGERPMENTLPEDYSSRPRVFFSYKWKFQPPDPANDLYLGFGADNHQFTMEVGLLRWMRVYGGLQFGGLHNRSDTLAFGFQGAGLGLKFHLYQWKRLAFFHEIGYFYLRRPYYNFYSSRFIVGNSLECRLAPGLYLYGGQVMGILNNYFIHEIQAGVTVSPGEIWGKR